MITPRLFMAAILLTAAALAARADVPATQPLADAKPLLQQINAAYAQLKIAKFNGNITANFDVAGQQEKHGQPFTSFFRAPNLFRHEIKDDCLLVSTGTKVFAFQPARNSFTSADAPPARAPIDNWPDPLPTLLQQQNPALLLALVSTPDTDLSSLAPDISLLPDTILDGHPYHTLQLEPPDHTQITMLVDPKTSLLRQVQFDFRKQLEARGALDVKQAQVTINYTMVDTTTPIADSQFAWAPPPDAVLAGAATPVDTGEDATIALANKPAPDFTLTTLDDQSIKLSKLKGSVVVLDFWASWCGPCVGSLPHLDDLNKEQSPLGLKVFAINIQEDKEAVKQFATVKGWSLPILLDTTGSVAAQYKANAIPETVIIGKDGQVKKVFVGAGNEDQIKSTVTTEMAR